MRGLLALTTLLLCLLLTSDAFSQTATGVGVGTGISSSRSNSAAVAVNQGNGGRATSNASGNGNSSLTVNGAAIPTTTTSNVNTSGTSTVKTVPSVFAPGLTAAGLETCLGSVSGGGSVVGTGLTFGTTIPDPGCAARLDSRTLWAMGLKAAAIARLCLQPEIYRSMPDICYQYLPRAGAPVAAVGFRESYASTNPSGSIELIDGKTGKPRMCSDYNTSRQRCTMWADGQRVHSKPKRTAAVAAVKPVGASAPAEPKTETPL